MTQFWRNKVLSVAKEFPDVLFAVANEEHFEEKLKELGLTESGEDINVAIYDSQDRRYAMVDEEFSEDSLTEFVQDFLKGKMASLPMFALLSLPRILQYFWFQPSKYCLQFFSGHDYLKDTYFGEN